MTITIIDQITLSSNHPTLGLTNDLIQIIKSEWTQGKTAHCLYVVNQVRGRVTTTLYRGDTLTEARDFAMLRRAAPVIETKPKADYKPQEKGNKQQKKRG